MGKSSTCSSRSQATPVMQYPICKYRLHAGCIHDGNNGSIHLNLLPLWEWAHMSACVSMGVCSDVYLNAVNIFLAVSQAFVQVLHRYGSSQSCNLHHLITLSCFKTRFASQKHEACRLALSANFLNQHQRAVRETYYELSGLVLVQRSAPGVIGSF